MSKKALEVFLQHIHKIRSSGACVDETSLYSPLSNYITEIGKSVEPKVSCFLGLKNTGSGYPDGGLFTEDQYEGIADISFLTAQKPKIAAIEVKSAGDDQDVLKIALSEQVQKYKSYGHVLVTNYRDFQLVTWADNKTVFLERYTLATSEAQFWGLAKQSKQSATMFGEDLSQFLQMVMTRHAQIHDSEQLAWFLAFYARRAKAQLEEIPSQALDGLRGTLENGLGLKFAGEQGEHFFRSSLIQTIFYGLFSAWVIWHTENKGAPKFDYRLSSSYLKLGVIRKLFHEITEPGQLKDFKLPEILSWAEESLNRTIPTAFFAEFEQGTAIQYFYEPFLKAFDPELRNQLGVWYTPKEVVSYMVARVHEVLQSKLKRPLGLADPAVYVLDPSCGTGSCLRCSGQFTTL